MIKCKICKSENIEVVYDSKIRNGGLGVYTEENVPIFCCQNCGVLWHDNILDSKNYYETTEYRESLEGGAEEKQFYRLHDGESLDKFQYTGTAIFRDKVVADVGCGCGAFLDFIYGVASSIIAIEPSETYRQIMDKKGFHTYSYLDGALCDYEGKVDVITSFDVIEHVEDPEGFLKDIFRMLRVNGVSIIGTPTDAPVLRQMLGEVYEKKILFSTQHLWIFSEKSIKIMAQRCGFREAKVKYFQRYGLNNLFGWIRDKEAGTEIESSIVTDTMDSVWKSQCRENNLGDYLVLYLTK